MNVMFRGTQPLVAGRDTLLRRVLEIVGDNLPAHETNDIQTLNPKHSGALRAFINREWMTTE